MTPLLVTFAACISPTLSTNSEPISSYAATEPTWVEWDLGNGMVIDAPASWGLHFSTRAEECYGGVQAQSTGASPPSNTIQIGVHWRDEPVGDFDLHNDGYEITVTDGSTGWVQDRVAVWDGESFYYSDREGIVSVAFDRTTENATVALRDVVLTGVEDGDRITLNTTHEFPLTVRCTVPFSGGEGDGDESGAECSGETDPFPYENRDCDDLTAEYPDSIKI